MFDPYSYIFSIKKKNSIGLLKVTINTFFSSSHVFFSNVNFSDVKFIHFYGKYLTFEPLDGFSKFKCLNALKFCQDSKYCGQPSNNNYLTAVQPSNNNYSTAELHSHLYVYFYSLLGKINNISLCHISHLPYSSCLQSSRTSSTYSLSSLSPSTSQFPSFLPSKSMLIK